jgi:hypothetical protein
MLGFLAYLSLLTLAAPPAAPAPGQLYVLAINGGGDRLDNFASHLSHLHQLVDVLTAGGVPKAHITVLASDGANPAADLATREPDPEHAWLLHGIHLDPLLTDLTTYESSTLPGVDLRPATPAALGRAITELRGRLHDGDTLLVYVTDHGTQSHRDPTGNRITLWGNGASVSVARLGAMLARLPRGVRVVSLMSQCYSGGFAYLHEAREHHRRPGGATCGYFSSTPDRPAYGCYPEVRGQKAIGHSFEFLSALAAGGRFPAAHAKVLTNDDTPDIPLRSSDVYLAELIGQHAPADAGEPAFADGFLHPALASGAYAEENRVLDAIAARFAVPRPRSMADLDHEADALFAFLDALDAQARVWESALSDFNQARVDQFLAAHPDWAARVQHAALRGLGPGERRALTAAFLRDLFASVSSDGARLAQANRLVTGMSETDELSYRTEIRVAALLRMRFVLTSIAGREWIKQHADDAAAVAALERCEDLSLPAAPTPARSAGKAAGAKLPAFADDERRAATLRPGWIGIAFVPVSPGRRKRLALSAGAATVTALLPRSTAAQAGLLPGDIVDGPPGAGFSHPRDLRPTIAAASPGSKLPLAVLRGGKRMVITTVVGEAPSGKK